MENAVTFFADQKFRGLNSKHFVDPDLNPPEIFCKKK
jgi:hypothetical protein